MKLRLLDEKGSRCKYTQVCMFVSRKLYKFQRLFCGRFRQRTIDRKCEQQDISDEIFVSAFPDSTLLSATKYIRRYEETYIFSVYLKNKVYTTSIVLTPREAYIYIRILLLARSRRFVRYRRAPYCAAASLALAVSKHRDQCGTYAPEGRSTFFFHT